MQTLALSFTSPVIRFAAVGLLLALAQGCKQDEAPPPLPEAKPAATPTTVVLPVEEEEPEAEEETPTKGGGSRRPAAGPLTACCAALQQNAANAPAPTNAYMQTAAATCNAMNNPAGAQNFLGMVGGLLKGAGVPAACQ